MNMTETALGIGVKAYTPDGRIAEMKLGNNLYETRDYHTPGTPTTYKLGTIAGIGDLTEIEYDFSPTANNGNVQAQRITRKNGATSGSTTWAQTYSYDGVNRLSYASEAGGWYRTYGYDRYGNRYVTTPKSGPAFNEPLEPTSAGDYNAANNRLVIIPGVREYDAAGNQTKYDGMTFVYDAEGRNTTVSGSSNVTFSYDGEGRRVKKVSGGITTYYVYNALGQLGAEYTNEAVETGTKYLFTDMLGSVRTITNSSGNVAECYDYLPFGRILSSSDNGRSVIKNASGVNCHPSTPDTNLVSSVDEKFTGQPRDNETGLDYFGARYLSAPQGRFMSPDLLGGNIYDPQTLNKYSYVRNNPLRFTDPTGMYICENDDGDTIECSAEDFVNFEKSRQKGLNTNNKDIIRAMEAYGDPNKDNGVRIRIGDPGNGKTGSILYGVEADDNAPMGVRAALTVTIKSGLNENDLMAAAAHEGTHAADAQTFIGSMTADGIDHSLNFTKYNYEMRAYLVEHAVHSMNNQTRPFNCGNEQCRLGVGAGNVNQQVQKQLSFAPYSVSPTNPGGYMYPQPGLAPKVTIPQR